MTTCQAREYVSLTVTHDTRQLAKHISAATGKSINRITAEAMKLLQEKYELPDVPKPKAA